MIKIFMIQLLLLLIGFIQPNNNTNTPIYSSHSIILQSDTDLGEGSDTGGETGTTLPPKK
jgi:hypothetical protein